MDMRTPTARDGQFYAAQATPFDKNWYKDEFRPKSCVDRLNLWHSIQDKNIKCENCNIKCKTSRIPRLQKYKGHLRTKRTKVIKGPKVQRLEKDQRCKGWNWSIFVTVTFPVSDFILRFAIYEMAPRNNKGPSRYNIIIACMLSESGLAHASWVNDVISISAMQPP